MLIIYYKGLTDLPPDTDSSVFWFFVFLPCHVWILQTAWDLKCETSAMLELRRDSPPVFILFLLHTHFFFIWCDCVKACNCDVRKLFIQKFIETFFFFLVNDYYLICWYLVQWVTFLFFGQKHLPLFLKGLQVFVRTDGKCFEGIWAASSPILNYFTATSFIWPQRSSTAAYFKLMFHISSLHTDGWSSGEVS